jgi:LacI family transcriptional regulator
MVNRYSYIVNESIYREFFMKIQEIAKLANVSTATVSRVFSRHPNVRPEVREAVLEVARKCNYRPRLSGKQKNVVLITPYKQLYPAAEFVEMVTSELIQQLSPAGFRIEIVPHDNLSRLSEISFCGAVGIGIAPPADWDEWYGVPLVVIDKMPEPGMQYRGVSFVHSDEMQGMMLAIEHLAACKCRKVGAIIHGTPGIGNVDIRHQGILDALEKCGLPVQENLVRIARMENFFEEMGKLLQQKIDGVFCCGGGNIGGVAAYSLNLYNRRIPEDIKLVSSERHRISSYCIPAQTTISPDYEKLACCVVEQLKSLLENSGNEFEISLPYNLIVREST